jgi:CHASE2 domain-containing sensor protein
VSALDGPYVGLEYFVEDDAGLFFGRDGERKRIIGNLQATRLTLLYAESGVGKTSLLRAGVSARIRQLAARSLAENGSARYVPVVFSAWQGDPTVGLIDALEAAVEPLVDDREELLLRRDALEHAIEDVAEAVDATPLIILDQFEEHFLYTPGDGGGFDDDLSRCIGRRDLRANFLLSVREDAYSLIGSRFKGRILDVYGNYLHLDFLDERAARAAVIEPIRAFNEHLAPDAPRFEIEAALVDAVVDQVRRGRVHVGHDGLPEVGATAPDRVETAYLQLVMKRLWEEEMAGGSRSLRLGTLKRLGGADTIVHAHLDDVLDDLPADQRDAAAAAFRYLVTPTGRKIALSTDELRGFSDAPKEPLERALAHLESERILRPVPSLEPDGVARHEIYHDVLAPAIQQWRRSHVEEAAEREVALERARTRRLEQRNRRLAAAVVALAAIALALGLYLWNPGAVQRLELATLDARFSVRGSQAADPRLVLIAVDDRTLARTTGHRQLSRNQFARLLGLVHAEHPAVVALDVIFQGAATPRADGALLSAMRAARDRLVLPFKNYEVVSRGNRQVVVANLMGRPGMVEEAGVRTAYAGLPLDVDDENRRTDYVVTMVGDPGTRERPAAAVRAPSFAFLAADVVRRGTLLPQADDLPAASRRAVGGQSKRTTWIDYRGAPGTVRRISALDVLDGRVAPSALRDKLVVIGSANRVTPDVHQTPFAAGRGMPGAEVQANALQTILRGSPLRDVPSFVDVLAILLLACLPAGAALVGSGRAFAAAVAGAAIAFLLIVQLAFYADRVVALVMPLVALLSGVAGLALVAGGRALRRRRTA